MTTTVQLKQEEAQECSLQNDNNGQRFVRLLTAGGLRLPRYGDRYRDMV